MECSTTTREAAMDDVDAFTATVIPLLHEGIVGRHNVDIARHQQQRGKAPQQAAHGGMTSHTNT